MSTDKSNKKEPDSDLYTLLTTGQLVELDKDFANRSIVEVVTQTPMRLYTRVKARQQFVKEFHEWNGDPENFDKDWLHLGDSTIMSFLAYKLETDAS